MAEPHVVTALVKKRAEMAGEIEAAEQRVDQLRADLIHLDATLRLFDPEALPETIPPKHPRPARADWFGRGELARRIFDALRDAERALCPREIALRAMQAKGFDPDDKMLAAAFTKRVDQALQRLRREGRVSRESGPGQTMVWRVAR